MTTLSIIGHVMLRIAIVAVVVGIVMWLWNLIIPAITGWATINYWKALGLTVLFHLLTAHPMRHPHMGYGMHPGCRAEQKMSFSDRKEVRQAMFKLREKMADMTPEERTAFLKEHLEVDGDKRK